MGGNDCGVCAMMASAGQQQGGMVTRIGTSLARPSTGMSWAQLAAAVVFVFVVAIAWRQVTHMIMREL